MIIHRDATSSIILRPIFLTETKKICRNGKKSPSDHPSERRPHFNCFGARRDFVPGTRMAVAVAVAVAPGRRPRPSVGRRQKP